jgi:hypothetical protein
MQDTATVSWSWSLAVTGMRLTRPRDLEVASNRPSLDAAIYTVPIAVRGCPLFLGWHSYWLRLISLPVGLILLSDTIPGIQKLRVFERYPFGAFRGECLLAGSILQRASWTPS